ncbi:MAG: BBP7 family outer membrane beta-barrel protein [Planctomycetaceae bacterium]|nr:BBP7 family outer membrane beta-barrel protein [Planctomycetaceae bacterium]
MHTNLPRDTHVVRRLGVLALVAVLAFGAIALWPATAWGQLYGRPVAQPCFDFPNWARWSHCRPGPLPWGYEVFPDYGPVDCAYGHDSVACEVDFVAHRPSDWYAMAEFAPLTLDYQEGFKIAQVGPTAATPFGPTVLTTNDLRPEFDAGGKFTLGRRIFDCYRIEGTYLGLYDFQDVAIVTNTDLSIPGVDLNDDGDFTDAGESAPIPASIGNLSTFLSGFADPAVPGLDANTQVAIAFESSFQSAEFNVRYYAAMPPGPFDVSYLVGFRYLRIHEQFNFVGEAVFPAVVTNDLQVNTENDLYGVQIGIQALCLKTTRWWLDVDIKGGIYNNSTSVLTDFQQTGSPGGGGFVERDRTAWVGDITVALNWQMTPTCAFRVGYQGIFINGLALAPDNAINNADLILTDTARLDDSGELAYHGPTIGLVWVR